MLRLKMIEFVNFPLMIIQIILIPITALNLFAFVGLLVIQIGSRITDLKDIVPYEILQILLLGLLIEAFIFFIGSLTEEYQRKLEES